MTPRAAPSGSLLARNRSATHEYSIAETFEAGIQLTGAEVKSLRAGRVQLREGYVRVERGEAWLLGVNIAQYEQSSRFSPDQGRRRKLLLHKREIEYLDAKVHTQGLTIVPLRMYLERNHVKVEIALVRGKKLWDKRQDVAKRDAQREMDRVTSRRIRDG
jgi:SsrA-binding protein